MSKSTQLEGFDLNHRAFGIYAKRYYSETPLYGHPLNTDTRL